VTAEDGSIDEFFQVYDRYYRKFPDYEAARKDVAEVFDLVVPKLVSWNLETKGRNPIPLDRDHFDKRGKRFQNAVIEAWLEAVQGVSRPLPTPSPSGEQSVAESIPMETLSENLPS
jgi:predicted RNase H-like HicB family nuclease